MLILNHPLWVTLIFHMNESNKNKRDMINICCINKLLPQKRATLLANKGVILRVTLKQSYLSTFKISFASSFLFYIFILVPWQLKDKTLIKTLQSVTSEIRAISGVTTWPNNCCSCNSHHCSKREIHNFFVLMKILKY